MGNRNEKRILKKTVNPDSHNEPKQKKKIKINKQIKSNAKFIQHNELLTLKGVAKRLKRR